MINYTWIQKSFKVQKKSFQNIQKSSGKTHKYEYLTGEDILPSNEQQTIEQAKFTYSPLGKVFEKQIKTTEDQGDKEIKAIQDQGKLKTIKKYDYDDEDTSFIWKQKKYLMNL